MLEALGAEGMSSDESDYTLGPDAKQFVVAPPIWRDTSLGDKLLILDKAYRYKRALTSQINARGQNVHSRQVGATASNRREPPYNLPRNFYKTDWLMQHQQRVWAKEAMQPGPVMEIKCGDASRCVA